MLVSVVIPCYNSQRTIAKVVEMVMAEFERIEGYECEFVLVNDCGGDDTFAEVSRLARRWPGRVRGLDLMRNFGQHNALMCAMNYVQGDLVLGMDDDMQTHPSQIHKLLECQAQGGYDVVYGVYRTHANGPLKNLTSWLNKVTSGVLLGRPRGVQSSNFWLVTRAVCDQVVQYRNFNPYVDGIFYRTSHNIGNVEVEHHAREVGTSGYTLRKLVNLWLRYFNYSVLPLHVVFVGGGVLFVAGLVAGLVIVVNKLLDPTMTVGWASLMCLMVVFFGVVLLVLGIIGEYLSNILQSMAINGMPQYIVRETVGFEDTSARPAPDAAVPGDRDQGGSLPLTSLEQPPAGSA